MDAVLAGGVIPIPVVPSFTLVFQPLQSRAVSLQLQLAGRR